MIIAKRNIPIIALENGKNIPIKIIINKENYLRKMF